MGPEERYWAGHTSAWRPDPTDAWVSELRAWMQAPRASEDYERFCTIGLIPTGDLPDLDGA